MNQTAHISLQILAISKSVETKSNWMRRNFLARPAQPYLCFSRQALRSVRSVVPSGVPLCASAPPVKGYLRMGPDVRKRFLPGTVIFFSKTWNLVQNQ
ncbi:MAG: hypothetical protein ACU0CN_00940, partial [Pseudooceanicola nanhaiensis]